MPLSKLYTDLVWTKKVPGIRDTSETMESMYEIIQVDGAGEIRLNVLVEGKKIITKNLSDAVERMNKINEILAFAKSGYQKNINFIN